MRNNRFLKRLRQELSEWVNYGWVKASDQQSILDHVASKDKDNRLLTYSITIIGVLLLGSGIITFFAANWAVIMNDIVRVEKGIQKIIMKIETANRFGDFPNLGTDCIGKSVEIFSEIGIPPSIKIGAKVSLVLRVSGDEWGQSLFLMAGFSNE